VGPWQEKSAADGQHIDGQRPTKGPQQSDGQRQTEEPRQADGPEKTDGPPRIDGQRPTHGHQQSDGQPPTEGQEKTEGPPRIDGQPRTNGPQPEQSDGSGGGGKKRRADEDTPQAPTLSCPCPGSDPLQGMGGTAGQARTSEPKQRAGPGDAHLVWPLQGANSSEQASLLPSNSSLLCRFSFGG
jgi:hypothetical protein